MYSTTGDDFFTYELKHDLKDRPGIDLDGAGRWVVAEVIRLGYRGEHHARFDGYVMGKYGGGRSKPKWIERIGKKYQWIALNRLIGHVSDHAPKTPSRWDPPPPPVPGPATSISRQIDPTVIEFEPASYNPTRLGPRLRLGRHHRQDRRPLGRGRHRPPHHRSHRR